MKSPSYLVTILPFISRDPPLALPFPFSPSLSLSPYLAFASSPSLALASSSSSQPGPLLSVSLCQSLEILSTRESIKMSKGDQARAGPRLGGWGEKFASNPLVSVPRKYISLCFRIFRRVQARCSLACLACHALLLG